MNNILFYETFVQYPNYKRIYTDSYTQLWLLQFYNFQMLLTKSEIIF